MFSTAAAWIGRVRNRTSTRAIYPLENDTQLSDSEVKARLAGYTDPNTTDHLFALGREFLGECVEAVHRLDAKAYAIAGYSGAVFSAMMALAGLGEKIGAGDTAPIFLFVAAFFALCAAGSALATVFLRPVEWLSPDEWFNRDCID